LTVTLDAIAQVPVIRHAVRTGKSKNGPEVIVWIPSSRSPNSGDSYVALLQQYAALNPHATFRLRHGQHATTFNASMGAWRKWLPRSPTSAHWYSVEDLTTLLAAFVTVDRETGHPRTVREVVAQFAGLTGSAKLKAVTDAADLTSATLTDLVLEGTHFDPARVARLLAAMQREARCVPPSALGVLGRSHCTAQLVTHWQVAPAAVRYVKKTGTVGGVPYLVEAACGIRGSGPRVLVVGCNFSPLLDPEESVDAIMDPLHREYVDDDDPVALLVHLTTPHPPFSGHAKRGFAFGDEDRRSTALTDAVTRVLPRRWKSRKRQAEKDRRSIYTPEKGAIERAAFAVMKQAYLKMSDNGTLPAHARQIFYAVRDLSGLAGALRDSYLTQTLLPSYQRLHPKETAGWDVVYDARGHITEPHTGRRVDLGTLAVRAYIAEWDQTPDKAVVVPRTIPTCGPTHRYRSALFIEKEGFMPLLEQVQLAERYDLAILSTKGMSNTASRQLVEVLSNQGVTIYVLHDFDRAGFSILHTLGSSTARYTFEATPKVIDLGLRFADVEALGLARESVVHAKVKKDPRKHLRRCGATEAEANILARYDRFRWVGDRVELNAMTSRQLIDWLEAKLVTHGVQKLVPSRDALAAAYRHAHHRARIQEAVDAVRPSLKVSVPRNLTARVRAWLGKHPTERWEAAVLAALDSR
jgi:hypothetical protein